ncbi:PhzF family phenazine biosynthesis protein [Streptomyces sporangiiformans]|uniref:PhzF family phenazine biosynthesis protein n=1 Tax=Streptomyces sporangiiformans TaxID=2315329 RepID=A0A505D6B6_9ACTN|nr:PhzF family phenazine biosynthesis protein [Streptomyces sporangiiformans]TPQ19254.1 PhzF family phenazine biosynthesis protein [Streptomyces sporangiiformans]
MAHCVPYALVDVFSDEPLQGNPLALVPDADELPQELMPRIAREFNQAETTFLLSPTRPGADWRLRSFTAAGVEVFGAGHNALGAWWWLAAIGRLGHREDRPWHQQLGSEVLEVGIAGGPDGLVDVTLRQRAAEYGQELTDRTALARALGVDDEDLGAGGGDRGAGGGGIGAGGGLPVAQVVSTGAAHLLVGLRGRAAVDAAAPDAARLRALLPGVGGQGVYLYALDPAEPGADVHARFVNPVAGITEDPATGSAAGPLACLLRRHGPAVGDRVTIAQGHALDRPSRIQVTFADDVPSVTGRAALAAEGTLRLPVHSLRARTS